MHLLTSRTVSVNSVRHRDWDSHFQQEYTHTHSCTHMQVHLHTERHTSTHMHAYTCLHECTLSDTHSHTCTRFICVMSSRSPAPGGERALLGGAELAQALSGRSQCPTGEQEMVGSPGWPSRGKGTVDSRDVRKPGKVRECQVFYVAVSLQLRGCWVHVLEVPKPEPAG